ncbi:hypothetical protein niasHT_010759 [Heterodera trifolii]|uniref:Uncharacterized protein n=1 Tax=Heterodera trifolii TaxID=157864 RepID=A0ABD2KV75_9BILA
MIRSQFVPLFFLSLFFLLSPFADSLFPQINGILPIRRSQMNKILDDDKTVDEKQKDNSGNGEKTGEENDNEPKAAFWENAIGPFLFVFENMDKRDRRSIWMPMIKELNRMRREQMGRKFEGLVRMGKGKSQRKKGREEKPREKGKEKPKEKRKGRKSQGKEKRKGRKSQGKKGRKSHGKREGKAMGKGKEKPWEKGRKSHGKR